MSIDVDPIWGFNESLSPQLGASMIVCFVSTKIIDLMIREIEVL